MLPAETPSVTRDEFCKGQGGPFTSDIVFLVSMQEGSNNHSSDDPDS